MTTVYMALIDDEKQKEEFRNRERLHGMLNALCSKEENTYLGLAKIASRHYKKGMFRYDLYQQSLIMSIFKNGKLEMQLREDDGLVGWKMYRLDEKEENIWGAAYSKPIDNGHFTLKDMANTDVFLEVIEKIFARNKLIEVLTPYNEKILFRMLVGENISQGLGIEIIKEIVNKCNLQEEELACSLVSLVSYWHPYNDTKGKRLETGISYKGEGVVLRVFCDEVIKGNKAIRGVEIIYDEEKYKVIRNVQENYMFARRVRI